MDELRVREMARMAELIRRRIDEHPHLAILTEKAVPVALEYNPIAIGLRVGEKVVCALEWPMWWDARFDTKEDHAAWIVHRLLMNWMETQGWEPGAEA